MLKLSLTSPEPLNESERQSTGQQFQGNIWIPSSQMSGDESLCNNPLLLGRKHFNYLQSQTNEVTRDQQNNDLKLMMTTEEAAAEDESTKKRSRSLSKSE